MYYLSLTSFGKITIRNILKHTYFKYHWATLYYQAQTLTIRQLLGWVLLGVSPEGLLNSLNIQKTFKWTLTLHQAAIPLYESKPLTHYSFCEEACFLPDGADGAKNWAPYAHQPFEPFTQPFHYVPFDDTIYL